MNFDIEEIEELSGDAASIYSVTIEGEEKTLLEQFFEENAEYGTELNEIADKLSVMGQETGCRWDYFKHNEGNPGDGVAVLKAGRLRLYCLYVDSTIVCFGSGGYKGPEIRAYQEDAVLNRKVEQMKTIAKRINKAIVEKDIEIKDGKLNINYWEYED
jgi:hypothetical protein